jgi:hypothetical protein
MLPIASLSNQDATRIVTSFHPIYKEYKKYVNRVETSVPTLFLVDFSLDSSTKSFESSPLTEIELADIEASEQEFARGEARVFDTVEDLLNYLHSDDEEDSTE